MILVEMAQTDGEHIAASFDMTYEGDLRDLLDADWRLTLRAVADQTDVLIELRSSDPLRSIDVAPTPGAANRVTFALRATPELIYGRGGWPDPIVYAGELLMETFDLAVAQARVELSLSRANTYPGLWL